MEWKQLLNTERIRAAGRAAGTPDPYDLRSPFEKDYHRIIGSASFRRLHDKTQVFPLDRGDFVRTRLTLSLETASLSRSLGASVGRALSGQAGSGFAPENTGDISTILSARACCMTSATRLSAISGKTASGTGLREIFPASGTSRREGRRGSHCPRFLRRSTRRTSCTSRATRRRFASRQSSTTSSMRTA